MLNSFIFDRQPELEHADFDLMVNIKGNTNEDALGSEIFTFESDDSWFRFFHCMKQKGKMANVSIISKSKGFSDYSFPNLE